MAEQAVKNQEQVKKEDQNKQEEHGLYVKTLEEIRNILPETFNEKQNKSGVTWFGPNRTRLMKVVESKKGLRIEFNVEVSEAPGLTILTPDEAKAKHMGTCRWIYSGDDLEVVKKMVHEAVKGFEPKKRSDSKEEKDKKDKKPEAEAKPQNKNNENKETKSAAKQEAPKATRKLTEEELKQIGK